MGFKKAFSHILLLLAVFLISNTFAYCNVNSDCLHNGVCLPGHACDCSGTNGYAGEKCEVPICDPPCFAGSCYQPNKCNCTGTGYKGTLCNEETCETPCQHGTCTGPNVCTCEPSWSGAICEIALCEPGCQAGGKCTSPNVCDCTGTGWEGDICEIPICNPPCPYKANCTGPNICDCRGTGYIGTQCEIDIDECLSEIYPCFSITEFTLACTNTNGSFICDPCPSGWVGDGKNCTALCLNPPCSNNGTCIRPEKCNCDGTGYQGEKCTIDVNECTKGACDSSVKCHNLIGSYLCEPCPAFYNGSGYKSQGGSQ